MQKEQSAQSLTLLPADTFLQANYKGCSSHRFDNFVRPQKHCYLFNFIKIKFVLYVFAEEHENYAAWATIVVLPCLTIIGAACGLNALFVKSEIQTILGAVSIVCAILGVLTAGRMYAQSGKLQMVYKYVVSIKHWLTYHCC